MEGRRAYFECPGCRLHHYPSFHLCRELAYRDLAGQLQHSGLLPSRFPGAKSGLGSLRAMVSRRLCRGRSWWSRYCGLRFPQQIRQAHISGSSPDRTLSSSSKVIPLVPSRYNCRLGLVVGFEYSICFVV
jgi:hypothetical protein